MLYLREYRPKADRLFDHLPWVALIGPGLVLNKDGSFQKTLAFRGPDLASVDGRRSGRHPRPAQQRPAAPGVALVPAHRGASARHRRTYPTSQFPDPVSDLGRRRAPRGLRGAGAPLREPLLPDLHLPAAGRSDLDGREPDAGKRPVRARRRGDVPRGPERLPQHGPPDRRHPDRRSCPRCAS